MTVAAKKITATLMDDPKQVATNQRIVLIAGIDAKHKIVDGEIFGMIVEAFDENKGALTYYPIMAKLVKDRELLIDYGNEFEDDKKGKSERPDNQMGYRYEQLQIPPEVKYGQILTLNSGKDKHLYQISSIEEPFKQTSASANVKPKTKTEPTKAKTETETVPKKETAKSAPVLSIADKPKK